MGAGMVFRLHPLVPAQSCGGRCPLKLDWFAVRGLRAENPTVVDGLYLRTYGEPLSQITVILSCCRKSNREYSRGGGG